MGLADGSVAVRSRRQPYVCIEQAMQRLGAFRQLREISFLERLGEGVEQAPHVPSCKSIMAWFTPFTQHRRNQPVAAHADIRGPDDQIVRINVGNFRLFVSGDPFVL